ncbi:MAG: M15 family metallopeptidase [Oscillospiraceae bacterium]|nr:M15 family metallopeptidase [Oscillospiraceae bacterium]
MRRMLSLFLVIFVLLCAACTPRPASDADSGASPSASPTDDTQAAATTSAIDKSAWNLVLVNKWLPLPDGFDSTLTLAAVGNGQTLDARIVADFQAMLQAGSAYQLHAQSGFRSVAQQTTLFNREVAGYTAKGYSQADAEALAAQVVARPGTSEHNTGLAVDMAGSGDNSASMSFVNTPAFAWLKDNCYKYGFILRYPDNTTAVTGITYEPWHYRYVGVEAATAIMSQGITLEQYLGWSPPADTGG